MYKIKEAIVVEGTYDKIRLSQIVDTLIIKTDGFSVYKNKQLMAMIKRIAKEQGIVIFTDSDSAGFQIRSFIKQNIPREYVKHAYIPDIKGKERRKREPGKEGLIGVEGVDNKVLIDALKKAGCEFFGENTSRRNSSEITKVHMFKLGFSGGAESKAKRERLLKMLKLPMKMSSNMLLEVLNELFTYDEFCEFLQKHDDI